MPDLAQSVLKYIRQQKLVSAGDRIGIAVSGGADSAALLRLLLDLRAELGIVLAVVHFNHKLRAEDSEEDEQFVRELARQHDLEFYGGSGNVRQSVEEDHLSIEAAARKLRYAYFSELLKKDACTRIATGHTLDDQAETVLLRLVRGAGTRGLAGIHPALSLLTNRWIVRPLLTTRRHELEVYLNTLCQPWREDKSNRDLRFARNRVRHGILPRLESNLNPSVREALASTAEIARAEEEFWQKQVEIALPRTWDVSSSELRIAPLCEYPLALQRRIVRAAGESLHLRLEFGHIAQILEVASNHSFSPLNHSCSALKVALPHDWLLTREKDALRFLPPHAQSTKNCDYSYVLRIPGELQLTEAGLSLQAALVSTSQASYNSQRLFEQYLFEPSLLGKELRVRNWRAGDRFWPAQTKSPKKIKELLQERHVSGEARNAWPVIMNEDEIIWVRGFSVPAYLRPKGDHAVMIRENPSGHSKAESERTRKSRK